jgi:catalase
MESNEVQARVASEGGAPSTPTKQPGTGFIDSPESPEVRSRLVQRVAQQQRVAADRNPSLQGRLDRAQHQKQLLGALGTLRLDDGLPEQLSFGTFAAGQSRRTAVRFSNGQPCPFRDQVPDVRGVALKYIAADGTETDLLMTNEDGRSHAKNGPPFLDFADIFLAAQLQGRRTAALRELFAALRRGSLGVVEAIRGFATLAKATNRPVKSLALETYVGSPVQHGTIALRHVLRPHAATERKAYGTGSNANYLREDLERRLDRCPLRFELGVQIFRDERSTPVNDASRDWKTPFVRIGELTIATRATREQESSVNRLAFNPKHGFGSLGITHLRDEAYTESAKRRGAATTDEARRLLTTD